jgi:hypothetical protein
MSDFFIPLHLAYAQDLGGREGLIRGNRLGTLRILR